ncbi:MAG: hypothetical protein HY342_06990 [Candidatus Lambdaproteobacteria bacterium]|nr:hypothetical protein [Candidatus Lambdaproteobacteria bacterium]
MPQIDTLATARRLEQAGFPTEQARAVSEAIADAIRDSQPDLSHLATLEALAREGERIRLELERIRSELRTEFQVQIKDLELRIAERLRAQMIWFFSMQAALLGIAVAIIKLFP